MPGRGIMGGGMPMGGGPACIIHMNMARVVEQGHYM